MESVQAQGGLPTILLSLLRGTTHDSAEARVVFIYIFIQGQGESADSSEHRGNLLQSAAQKDPAVTLITMCSCYYEIVLCEGQQSNEIVHRGYTS